MTRSRLFEPVTEWFRTRWTAAHWTFRILYGLIIALAATYIVAGNWLGALLLVPWLYIVADWQYWQERGRLAGPLATIGAAVAGELHAASERGHRIVTLRREGSNWTVYRDE